MGDGNDRFKKFIIRYIIRKYFQYVKYCIYLYLYLQDGNEFLDIKELKRMFGGLDIKESVWIELVKEVTGKNNG